jgi:hypothetical protein
MAGADKAHRADGVGFEVFAEPLVEREERGLHGLHEEAVAAAGDGEDFGHLALVQGSRLFAEHVLAGFQSLDAEAGVAVRMSGDIDGVDAGGQEKVQRVKDFRHAEAEGIGLSALGVAAPDGGERGALDGAQPLGKAGGGMARTGDAPADWS